METIRGEYIPAAFDGVDAEVFVGGVTAEASDVFSIVQTYTPIVFTFVLGFSFLVLMLVFRSIVIPMKAVFRNLLSVGTAYGLMVLVFQNGVATDLFGFSTRRSSTYGFLSSSLPCFSGYPWTITSSC